MEGQNAAAGGGCTREINLYICWEDFLKESAWGNHVTMGGGNTVWVKGIVLQNSYLWDTHIMQTMYTSIVYPVIYNCILWNTSAQQNKLTYPFSVHPRDKIFS